MKLCLACHTQYNATRKECPSCGALPVTVDDFDAYAPDLAHGGGGFKASSFAELARLEEANFWFRARNQLIIWALKKYALNFNSFLEIGCGTGFVLTGIATNFPKVALSGSEIFTEGLGFAAKRLPSTHLMQMDARQIPFVEEFDAIGAFDVLEHIEEDELVLAQVQQALRSGGTLILTVPQHPWLWSHLDEYACHVRRYRASELQDKVQQAGFKIQLKTSFVSLLLPAMLASRMLKRSESKNKDPAAELRLPPLLNYIFERVMKMESHLIHWGIRLPLGGSLLLVATKL